MIQTSGIFTGGGEGGKYKPYLTFRSPYTFTLSVATPGWNGTVEYSTDTETWTTWDGSQVSAALSSAGDDAGYYVLYLRGTGNTVFSGASAGKFVMTGASIACIGNIEMLLDYATAITGESPTMQESCFSHAFYGCSPLVIAPELPALTVPPKGYLAMFQACDHLVLPPVLPAATVGNYGFKQMFSECTSLIGVPRLHTEVFFMFSATLMFSNCANIKVSSVETEEYTLPYKVPWTGEAPSPSSPDLLGMFDGTGGTFTGNLTVNTTYYVSNTNIVV